MIKNKKCRKKQKKVEKSKKKQKNVKKCKKMVKKIERNIGKKCILFLKMDREYIRIINEEYAIRMK